MIAACLYMLGLLATPAIYAIEPNMTDNIVIKILSAEQWQELKQIRLEALQKHPESFGSSYESEVTKPEEDWKSMLTNNSIFAAFLNDQIVGIAGFSIFKRLKEKHRGNLSSFYIKEEHRRQKIGDKLLSEIIQFAKDKVLQLHCTVVTSNIPAVKLYEKHGFEIYGKEQRSLRVGEQFYDEYFMVNIFDKNN